jgi:sulfatase maturation enzyme AslB (radical SAM superfamily)
MRCAYCRVIDSGLTLTWQKLKRFLLDESFLFSSHVGNIHLYGGEPCLEFPLVTRLLRTLRDEIGFEGEISMFTNGTLLNRKRVEILNDHGVKVIVSIDSTGFVNDRERTLRSRSGTVYEKAFRAAGLVGYDMTRVHVTLTSGNIEAFPGFLSFLANAGIYDVGIFPADYVEWSDKSIKSLKMTMSSVLNTYGDLFSFVHYYQNVLDVSVPERRKCDRIYLGPDGNFYICKCFAVLPSKYAERYSIGSLQDGIDFEKRETIFIKLYNQIRAFEKTRFRSRRWKSIMPFIYCPVNNMVYSTHIRRDPVGGLVTYYKVMRAFCEPIVEFGKTQTSFPWNEHQS